LGEQPLLLLEAPVVEDVAEDEHLGVWQGRGEEIRAHEPEPLAQAGGGDVALEERPERRQVEPDAGEMPVARGDLHREGALGTAEVDEGPMAMPRKTLRDRARRGHAETAHRAREE